MGLQRLKIRGPKHRVLKVVYIDSQGSILTVRGGGNSGNKKKLWGHEMGRERPIFRLVFRHVTKLQIPNENFAYIILLVNEYFTYLHIYA